MNRLAPDAEDARYIRRVIITIVLIALAVVLYRASDLIILAFGSVLGAIAIHALADLWHERVRLPWKWALPAGILSALAILGFLGWMFGVEFRSQVNLLVEQLPRLLDQLSRWASQSPVGAKIVAAVRSAYAGSRAARDVSGLVSGTGEFLLNCLILIFGAMFFAADPAIYRRGFLLLVPPSQRGAVADAVDDLGATLRLWLRAELILMTSMGILIGIGLWFSDVPSAPALGLLAGLSEFIPYLGPTAAMLPALGLGAVAGSGPLIGALVTYAVVRLIQSNLITPFVTSRVISIPPAMTLFMIIGMGYVFGLFALFFAAALLVVVFSLVRSLYLREVLGEDIPLAAAAPPSTMATPRDSPESLD